MTKGLSIVWFQGTLLSLTAQTSSSITLEDHSLSSNASGKNKWQCKYKLLKKEN